MKRTTALSHPRSIQLFDIKPILKWKLIKEMRGRSLLKMTLHALGTMQVSAFYWFSDLLWATAEVQLEDGHYKVLSAEEKDSVEDPSRQQKLWGINKCL